MLSRRNTWAARIGEIACSALRQVYAAGAAFQNECRSFRAPANRLFQQRQKSIFDFLLFGLAGALWLTLRRIDALDLDLAAVQHCDLAEPPVTAAKTDSIRIAVAGDLHGEGAGPIA